MSDTFDRPTLSQKDIALFRGEMDDTVPLRPHGRVRPPRRRPSPHPRFTAADEADVLEHLLDHPIEPEQLESGEELYYRRPGVQNRVLRKLRRGQYRISAELDLHGMTAALAKEALAAFLAQCHDRDMRCIRIIHGKGLRSRHRGPVLKSNVDRWLRRRDDVVAFCSAPPHDGGTGAIYVLLRT